MHLQIQSNWTFGEVLDENAKTHPMLRPYKTFSEKVREGFLKLFFFFFGGGEGGFILQQIFHCVFLHMLLHPLLCRIKKFTAGLLKNP